MSDKKNYFISEKYEKLMKTIWNDSIIQDKIKENENLKNELSFLKNQPEKSEKILFKIEHNKERINHLMAIFHLSQENLLNKTNKNLLEKRKKILDKEIKNLKSKNLTTEIKEKLNNKERELNHLNETIVLYTRTPNNYNIYYTEKNSQHLKEVKDILEDNNINEYEKEELNRDIVNMLDIISKTKKENKFNDDINEKEFTTIPLLLNQISTHLLCQDEILKKNKVFLYNKEKSIIEDIDITGIHSGDFYEILSELGKLEKRREDDKIVVLDWQLYVKQISPDIDKLIEKKLLKKDREDYFLSENNLNIPLILKELPDNHLYKKYYNNLSQTIEKIPHYKQEDILNLISHNKIDALKNKRKILNPYSNKENLTDDELEKKGFPDKEKRYILKFKYPEEVNFEKNENEKLKSQERGTFNEYKKEATHTFFGTLSEIREFCKNNNLEKPINFTKKEEQNSFIKEVKGKKIIDANGLMENNGIIIDPFEKANSILLNPPYGEGFETYAHKMAINETSLLFNSDSPTEEKIITNENGQKEIKTRKNELLKYFKENSDKLEDHQLKYDKEKNIILNGNNTPVLISDNTKDFYTNKQKINTNINNLSVNNEDDFFKELKDINNRAINVNNFYLNESHNKTESENIVRTNYIDMKNLLENNFNSKSNDFLTKSKDYIPFMKKDDENLSIKKILHKIIADEQFKTAMNEKLNNNFYEKNQLKNSEIDFNQKKMLNNLPDVDRIISSPIMLIMTGGLSSLKGQIQQMIELYYAAQRLEGVRKLYEMKLHNLAQEMSRKYKDELIEKGFSPEIVDKMNFNIKSGKNKDELVITVDSEQEEPLIKLLNDYIMNNSNQINLKDEDTNLIKKLMTSLENKENERLNIINNDQNIEIKNVLKNLQLQNKDLKFNDTQLNEIQQLVLNSFEKEKKENEKFNLLSNDDKKKSLKKDFKKIFNEDLIKSNNFNYEEKKAIILESYSNNKNRITLIDKLDNEEIILSDDDINDILLTLNECSENDLNVDEITNISLTNKNGLDTYKSLNEDGKNQLIKLQILNNNIKNLDLDSDNYEENINILKEQKKLLKITRNLSDDEKLKLLIGEGNYTQLNPKLKREIRELGKNIESIHEFYSVNTQLNNEESDYLKKQLLSYGTFKNSLSFYETNKFQEFDKNLKDTLQTSIDHIDEIVNKVQNNQILVGFNDKVVQSNIEITKLLQKANQELLNPKTTEKNKTKFKEQIKTLNNLNEKIQDTNNKSNSHVLLNEFMKNEENLKLFGKANFDEIKTKINQLSQIELLETFLLTIDPKDDYYSYLNLLKEINKEQTKNIIEIIENNNETINKNIIEINKNTIIIKENEDKLKYIDLDDYKGDDKNDLIQLKKDNEQLKEENNKLKKINSKLNKENKNLNVNQLTNNRDLVEEKIKEKLIVIITSIDNFPNINNMNNDEIIKLIDEKYANNTNENNFEFKKSFKEIKKIKEQHKKINNMKNEPQNFKEKINNIKNKLFSNDKNNEFKKIKDKKNETTTLLSIISEIEIKSDTFLKKIEKIKNNTDLIINKTKQKVAETLNIFKTQINTINSYNSKSDINHSSIKITPDDKDNKNKEYKNREHINNDERSI